MASMVFVDWGSCFLDHLEKNLTSISTRDIFRPRAEHEYSIQILGFDRVFSKCRVFASLGLSHYAEAIGERCEIVLPVDTAWEHAPKLLANALFYLVGNRMKLGRGVAVGGIANILPEFCTKFGMSAVYFTFPHVFPEGFQKVNCGTESGRIYLAFFITASELRYFEDNGAERFEDVLQARAIDPFSLIRPSAI